MLLHYHTKSLNNNLHFNKSKGFQRASPALRPLLFCSSFICTFADVEVHPGHKATTEPSRIAHQATTKLPPSYYPDADLTQITFSLTLKTSLLWRMEKRNPRFGRTSFDWLKSLQPHSLASLVTAWYLDIYYFINFNSYIYGKR